ncbi:MAG: hypothetical protein AB8B55_23540 [Mariniblastus sp.]
MKTTRHIKNLKLAITTGLALFACDLSLAQAQAVQGQHYQNQYQQPQEESAQNGIAQNGLSRLMNKAKMKPPAVKFVDLKVRAATFQYDEEQVAPPTTAPKVAGPICSETACLIPSTVAAADRNHRASLTTNEGINFTDPSGFLTRQDVTPLNDMVYPMPLGYNLKPFGTEAPKQFNPERLPKISTPGYNGWNPDAARDEYVFDGNDRAEKVRVDQSFNLYGLETEDTVGHFDTLDGRRLVTPSNRVAIYAPRFGAVRKVDGIFKAKLNTPVGALEEQTPIAMQGGKHEATTTKQHLALNRYEGATRASGFIDQTRGVTSGAVTHLFGVRNTFQAYENLMLIRLGKFSSGESARLNLGIQSALAWEDNLGLQVVTKKASPIIVRDVATVQQLVTIESEDGSAILRVTKIASKIAARAGEEVEFTIRYDNLSGKKIGNVTLIDNLTRRLEYIPNSTESSLKADFVTEQNDGGSLMLRWEITEPVDAHKGGIIRFKCRVR